MITNTVATRISVDDQMTKHLQSIQKHMGTFAGTVDKQSSQIMNDFKRIATSVIGVTAAFQGIKKVVNEGISFNRFMQEQQTAFTVMMKSSDAAKAKIQELYDFAVNTPLTFKETTSAARQLMAYGFGADELLGSMRTLGTVAKATGHSLSDITYVYGTLRSQGRAYTRDLMQFGMRGIPIYEELSKVMGVNVEQLKKMTEEGKIGFKEVEQAFKNMTGEGGRFAGMLEEYMNTLSGKLSMFTDIFQQSAGALTKELTDQLLPVIDELIKRLKDSEDTFRAIGYVGGQTFRGLADAAFFLIDAFEVLWPILLAVAAAFTATLMPAITAFFSTAIAGVVALGAAISATPFGWVLVGLGLAYAAAKVFFDYLERRRKANQEAMAKQAAIGASINGMSHIKAEMASMRGPINRPVPPAPPTKEMNDYMAKLRDAYAKFLAERQRDEFYVADAVVQYERMKKIAEAKAMFADGGPLLAEAIGYIDKMAAYEAKALRDAQTKGWTDALEGYWAEYDRMIAEQKVKDMENVYAVAELEYEAVVKTISAKFKGNKTYEQQALTLARNMHAMTMMQIKTEHEERLEAIRKEANERRAAEGIAALDQFISNTPDFWMKRGLDIQGSLSGNAGRDDIARVLRELRTFQASLIQVLQNKMTTLEKASQAVRDAQVALYSPIGGGVGASSTSAGSQGVLSASSDPVLETRVVEMLEWQEMAREELQKWQLLSEDMMVMMKLYESVIASLDKAAEDLRLSAEAAAKRAQALERFDLLAGGDPKYFEDARIKAEASFSKGNYGQGTTSSMVAGMEGSTIGRFLSSTDKAATALIMFGEAAADTANQLFSEILGGINGLNIKQSTTNIANGISGFINKLTGASDAAGELADELDSLNEKYKLMKADFDLLVGAVKDMVGAQVKSLQDLYEVGALSGAEYSGAVDALNLEMEDNLKAAYDEAGLEYRTLADLVAKDATLKDVYDRLGSVAEALGVTAEELEKQNDKAKDSTSGISDAVSMGMSGAAIGAVVGGPIGAVIGGLGGALIGGLGNAFGWWDTGTTELAKDQFGMVHKGEAIIPKTFADGIRSGEMVLSGKGNSRSASLGGDTYVTVNVEGSVQVEEDLATSIAQAIYKQRMTGALTY